MTTPPADGGEVTQAETGNDTSIGSSADRKKGLLQIEPGVQLFETEAQTGTGIIKLWIFLPQERINAASDTNIPCILIAPAGTPMIWGSTIGREQFPEILPYVRAGYYAVNYEIEGNCSPEDSNEVILTAISQFRDAHAGISDERAAMDYALKLPRVDKKRIYVAGHSSAASLALLSAEYDSRVAGCIAYAPATDIIGRTGAKTIKVFQAFVPDIKPFLINSSPITAAAKLKCPVFLFHADDDTNVPAADNAAFAKKLSKTNKHVTFVRVPTGNHYKSMIREGIPKAIEWLKTQP